MAICISIEQLDKLHHAKLVEVESLAGEARLKPANIRAKLYRYRDGQKSSLTFPEAKALGEAFERLLACAGFVVSNLPRSEQMESSHTPSSAPSTLRDKRGEGSKDAGLSRHRRPALKKSAPMPRPAPDLPAPPKPPSLDKKPVRLPGVRYGHSDDFWK